MFPASPDHRVIFDFSLDRLDVALQAPDGQWLIPHQAFDNNWAGFCALKQLLLAQLAQGVEPVHLTAVGESSGLYWWHAFFHIATDPELTAFAPDLALLNPKHVKHFRQALPEQDKTDEQDPMLIGRYYQSYGVKDFYTFNLRYLPLRQLTRAYGRLSHTLAAEKAFCGTLVYLLASEYVRRNPFSTLFGATSAYILTEYPDIEALADLPVEELAELLNTQARGHLKDPIETARQLHQVAELSYPLPEPLATTVHTVLGLTLDHIRFLERQRDTYQTHLATHLATLPEAHLALAEKGLGIALVAGCLGEIQDTRRFTTGQKYDRQLKRWRARTYRDGQVGVANLAGLWWPQNASGRFEGQARHLAQERNPYLRYWLTQAAHSLKRHRDDYADYYQRKFNESTHHPHQRALILTARKATRLIFALLHKGQMARPKEGPAD
jgi:transposase